MGSWSKCPDRGCADLVTAACVGSAPDARVAYESVAARKRRHPSFYGVQVVKPLATILLVVISLCVDTALAQPSADAKALGKFSFYGRSARSAMRGARESTGSFREYIRSAVPVSPQIVREEPGAREGSVVREQMSEIICNPRIVQVATDEIGDYITKSEKHLAWMRRQAEAQKDKETLASLDSIDRNLIAAKQTHASLCSQCMADNMDATAAMACCQTIDDALGKAIAEHDVLMKRLGEKQPGDK